MDLKWNLVLIAGTALLYLVVAFIQFRRAWLMSARVKHLKIHGEKASGKVLNTSHSKFAEVEFTNLSGSRVITDFRVDNNKTIAIGSSVDVFMGNEPKNSPAIVMQYGNNKTAKLEISRYALFGVILVIIAAALGSAMSIFHISQLSSHIGPVIALIAALAVFVAVTEDDMAQNRIRNQLLLFGLNATAQIRKAGKTGIKKDGFQQISFFLQFHDKNGNTLYGKAEEPLEVVDYEHFRKERKVDILYSPKVRNKRCLLNYTWQ